MGPDDMHDSFAVKWLRRGQGDHARIPLSVTINRARNKRRSMHSAKGDCTPVRQDIEQHSLPPQVRLLQLDELCAYRPPCKQPVAESDWMPYILA